MPILREKSHYQGTKGSQSVASKLSMESEQRMVVALARYRTQLRSLALQILPGSCFWCVIPPLMTGMGPHPLTKGHVFTLGGGFLPTPGAAKLANTPRQKHCVLYI